MKSFKSFFSRKPVKEESITSDLYETIVSPVTGKVIPIEDVSDKTFADKILGDGIAVEPSEGKVYAPADGEISSVIDTFHAVGITSAGGAEILIHVGKDTVELKGRYFKSHIKEGQKVKRGDLLLEFDLGSIRTSGFELTTPVVISNYNEFIVEKTDKDHVTCGDVLMTLKKKE